MKINIYMSTNATYQIINGELKIISKAKYI